MATVVKTSIAPGILQSVVLALLAIATLLERIVESEFPCANRVVPLIAASLGLFVGAGVIIVSLLLLELGRTG